MDQFSRWKAVCLGQRSALFLFVILSFGCADKPEVAPVVEEPEATPVVEEANVLSTARIEIRGADRSPFEGAVEYPGPGGESLYVEPEAAIVASDFHHVSPGIDDLGDSFLKVTLTPEGAAKMERMSSQRTGKLMAVLVDDEVIAAPTVIGTMSDQIQLHGLWTQEEVNDLLGRVVIAR